MSAKEKQVVEVQEKLEDIKECSICTETYKEPKILPCIHTFCMTCLQETGLKTDKSPGDKMSCPVCRTEFTVPEKGFVGLQRNFFMERLIEMKNILNPSSTRVVCDACQEDLGAEAEIPSAAMYCADCNQRLCEDCCKIHRKYKVSKDHRMLTLDGAQINIPSNVKPYVWDKLEDRQLEIYCSSCHEAVCALCLYKSHKTHDTSPVIDVVTDFRRIIQENAERIMSFILDLKQKRKGGDDDKAVFARKVAEVEIEIKRTRQDLQECIEKDFDSLLQQLNCIKLERIKANESQICDMEAVLASLLSYHGYCTRLTATGSDVDICRAVHNLSTRATELQQLCELISVERLPSICLKNTEFHNALHQPGKNIIGKIEENGDINSSHAEIKKPIIDSVSSFLDELSGILDNSSVGDMEDISQSKEISDILERSQVCTVETVDDEKHQGGTGLENEGMDKDRFVEVFETPISEEMKEWTICDKKLSDKLKHLKVKIRYILQTNDKLKNEMNFQQERVSRLEAENISMNREAEVMKLTGMQLNEENTELKKQVALLTSIAYNGDRSTKVKKTVQYKRGLTFLQTIRTVNVHDEKTFRVTGLAILDNELFIASTSAVVEVNDLSTLQFKRQWRATQLKTIIDMKPSVRNKCLSILCGWSEVVPYDPGSSFRFKKSTTETQMVKFDDKGNRVTNWRLDDAYNDTIQISVTEESNVLVTDTVKLTEYSPDGKLIRQIHLRWETGILNPTHAIKLTSDHFVVCHGTGCGSLHRVCIIDIDGNVLKYFGEVGRNDKLNKPVYLEMDADGNILVADHLNRRLLLLSSSLEFMQELNPHIRGVPYMIEHRPRKMILDDANGRIFVAENSWKVSGEEDCKTQYGDQLSVFTFSLQ